MPSSTSDTETGIIRAGVLSRLASEFSFVRGNFLLLIVSWLVMDFAREMPGTYYPLYVQALGGSAATIGLIGFAATFSQALVMFPGGYLADKYGRRWLISTMLFGVAFSWVFYAIAQNWHTIMIGAVIAGLCMIYMPAFNALIMDSLPAEKRGMGFSLINLIEAVSTTPAPLIAGLMYASWGLMPSMRIGYAITFVAFIGAAVIRLRIKETLEDPPRVNKIELLRSIPKSITDSFRVWGNVPRAAFTLFIVSTTMMFSVSMIQPILVLYIINDLGISPTDWALIATSLFISMLALAIPAGKMIDKVGKKISLLLSFVLTVASMLLLINGDIVRLYISVPFYGLLIILINSSTGALFADLIPRELRGKVSGFTGFFNLIAISLGMLIGGILYDNVSHTLPLLLQFVFLAPPLIMTLLFIKEPSKKEE